MTVSELRHKLRALPDDMPVMVPTYKFSGGSELTGCDSWVENVASECRVMRENGQDVLLIGEEGTLIE